MFYSLEEGNTQDEAFFVEPVSGELTIQRPLTHLDTPTSTYTLTIRATDAGNVFHVVVDILQVINFSFTP